MKNSCDRKSAKAFQIRPADIFLPHLIARLSTGKRGTSLPFKLFFVAAENVSSIRRGG